MIQAHYTTQPNLRGWLPMLLLVLLLAGCQGSGSEPVAAVPATVVPSAAVQPTAASSAKPTAAQPAAVSAPSTTIIQTEPVSADEASPPIQLRIPAIGLDVVVSPMEWRVTEVNAQRTTVWVLPQSGVGWHPNSTPAGSAGNVVISGHQLLGDASFALLALGDVVIGQEILLTDSEATTFVYRVTDVSEPEPITTDADVELALAESYTAQEDEAVLTLVTGWPDYSSTHRIFVRAAFVGVAE